ncbi:MAG: Ldh family oxidoreductase, partial [Cupriavidus sp.]|nr:Ldh family oxidoreductase [Cupriavidus sp.]
VDALLAAMLDDEGTGVPGDRRETAQAQAAAHGVDVPDSLWRELQSLAGEEAGAPH